MSVSVALQEEDFDYNPFSQFHIWYSGRDTNSLAIPDSVSLGTASAEGRVSVRTVLLKGYDTTGFVFYTNYGSRKSSDMASNPKAALLFYWPECSRQIRIEGSVVKVTEEESQVYFASRPRDSQLSAWASKQSSVVADRKFIENRFEFYKNEFAGKIVEKPPFWGGFRLLPDWFEFWQDGGFRLHDRISYKKTGDSWILERLAP